jgi:N-acetylglutamate synthase-like GNAT family acetyltransferase
MEILDLKDEPEHLPVLAEWHHKEWSDFNPDETIEQRIERMHAYLNESFIPSTFIAKDGELLASASIVAHDMETKPDLSPWLASVFVAPEQRGKGLGKRLVLHVMNEAKNRGIDTLYLFTPDKVPFYQKLGWKIVTQEQYRGHEVTIMTINLDGQK